MPRGQQLGFVYHVINRGNGRATIFHKAHDYFGLRLFQTFQEPALSSIEGFNRCAPFITGDQSVRAVPIVQPLCSVQNVSGILETSKGSTNQVGGRVAIEPLSLRHNRCRLRIAIFYPVTHGTSLTAAIRRSLSRSAAPV
jgi:hypothetical protein